MTAPEGYSNPPAWMGDVLNPIYEELKAIVERGHVAAIKEAQRRGEDDPEMVGIMAMIGMSVQSNLLLLAKGIARKPHWHPARTANSLSMDVHNSTIVTFDMMCQALVAAQTETQQ